MTSVLASEQTGSKNRLAIVIVTRNRQKSLERTLHKLTSLEDEYPILVVDNASEDDTVTLVRDCFPDVKLIALGTNQGTVARNLGVEVLNQPYIAFYDDDSWWAYGSLSRAIEIFDRHSCLGLIMSKILIEPEGRYDPCCQSMEESPLTNRLNLPGFPVLGFIACGVVVRRAAFQAAGGFNARFGTCGEEELLAIDLAKKDWGLSYIPRVVSHHHPSKARENSVRAVQEIRNNLWTYWMRRSFSSLSKFTGKYVRAALTDRIVFAGLTAALRGAGWAIRQRDAVPGWLERQLELKETRRGNC